MITSDKHRAGHKGSAVQSGDRHVGKGDGEGEKAQPQSLEGEWLQKLTSTHLRSL